MTLFLYFALFHPNLGTQVVTMQKDGIEFSCFVDTKATWNTTCYAVREVLTDDGFLGEEKGGREIL